MRVRSGCSHTYEVPDGPYAGTSGEGPEYETLNALGSRLGNDDLASILHEILWPIATA